MSEPTEEELSGGQSALCYGPCESFPEGRKVLIPPHSLRGKLAVVAEQQTQAHAELRQAERDKIQAARESLAAGDPVPPEKTVI